MQSCTVIAAWLIVCVPHPLWAGTLDEAVKAALLNDPVVKAAAAQRNASREARPQAWSKWLPQVSAQAGKSQAHSVQEYETPAGVRTPPNTINYDSDYKAVTLKQSLFNPRAWYNLRQSGALVSLAEAAFALARYDAVNRVVGGFADKLRLEAELEAAKMNIVALESRFRQAKRLENIGQSSLLDVIQAEAGLRQGEAKLGEQSARLQATNRELARLTGMPWDEFITDRDYRSLAIRLAGVIENSMQRGAEAPLESHPEVVAQQMNLDAANLEIRKTQSDHSPTVDFLMSWADGTSVQDTSIGQSSSTTNVGVQLTIPIFSGGSVLSSSREKYALKEKAEYDLLQSKTRIQNERQRTLSLLRAAVLTLKASVESEKAAELQLKQTLLGMQAGIRSQVDLDDSRSKKAQEEAGIVSNLAQSLILYTQWRLANGSLAEDEFQGLSTVISGR